MLTTTNAHLSQPYALQDTIPHRILVAAISQVVPMQRQNHPLPFSVSPRRLLGRRLTGRDRAMWTAWASKLVSQGHIRITEDNQWRLSHQHILDIRHNDLITLDDPPRAPLARALYMFGKWMAHKNEPSYTLASFRDYIQSDLPLYTLRYKVRKIIDSGALGKAHYCADGDRIEHGLLLAPAQAATPAPAPQGGGRPKGRPMKIPEGGPFPGPPRTGIPPKRKRKKGKSLNDLLIEAVLKDPDPKDSPKKADRPQGY